MTTAASSDEDRSLTSRMAEEVRVLMVRRRATQAEIGLALGLSQVAVSHRLNGRTGFSVHELGLLADFFEVSPADLLGDSGLSPTPGYLGNETYAVVLPFRATRARRRTLPPMPAPPTTPGQARPALRRAS